jgi:cytochrome c oxidase subunit 3
MNIGTAESEADLIGQKRPTAGIRSRSGGGPGRGGGEGGDGDQMGRERADTIPADKARIVTWFVLVVVLMTFGGLAAAYIVIKTNGVAEWQPFALPVQVWISTVLLAASSVTYHFARSAIERYDQPAARRWLVTTTVLGAGFISSQILAWIALWQRGLFVSGNPFAGFFYILTAVHALHVLGGIVALGSVLLHAWDRAEADRSWPRLRSLAAAVGMYWHFMDGVWLVLFILLGFWN